MTSFAGTRFRGFLSLPFVTHTKYERMMLCEVPGRGQIFCIPGRTGAAVRGLCIYCEYTLFLRSTLIIEREGPGRRRLHGMSKPLVRFHRRWRAVSKVEKRGKGITTSPLLPRRTRTRAEASIGYYTSYSDIESRHQGE